MIRMTRQADYGIILMTQMAAAPGRLFTAPGLASETQLPQPTVSKILKLLGRGGLLDSHRGVKGGYTLRAAPESISVAQIIGALDGPIAITECIDDVPGECAHERFCPVRGNWQRINRAIRDSLEAISLAEMTRPEPRDLVTLGAAPAHPAEAG